MGTKKSSFTAEEEARIQAEIVEYEKRKQEERIATEARVRIMEEQRKKPGYKY